jgi:hypothetical protein
MPSPRSRKIEKKSSKSTEDKKVKTTESTMSRRRGLGITNPDPEADPEAQAKQEEIMSQIEEYKTTIATQLTVATQAYESLRDEYINQPITDDDYGFEYTFDIKEAEENIRRKRAKKFDELNPTPEDIYLTNKGQDDEQYFE